VTPPKNRASLDFLRGFSTLAVVGIHWEAMNGQLPSALAGLPRIAVLMFFVHTGFVLMLSLERQHARSPDQLWRRFMIRRLFRIYPLGMFVIAVILVFGVPSRLIPPDFGQVRLDGYGIAANFLLVTNLTGHEPILSPMWSLPYEFQTYLFLPASYLVLRRCSGLFPSLGLWFLAVALALLQPFIPHGSRLDILEFFPCLVAGILGFRLSSSVSPRLPFLWWPVLLISIMAITLSWTSWRPWPAAWITGLLTAVCVPYIQDTNSASVRRLCGWLAERSYSIYLSHYFCLWLAFRTNDLKAPVQWAIFIITMGGLPELLYRTIELPMIHIGRHVGYHRATSALDAIRDDAPVATSAVTTTRA